MDPELSWRNKVQLFTEEIKSIKRDYTHEIKAPAKYWEDKFRL